MKTTFVYKKAENFEINGDFYPISEKGKPVIIYIHGGGLLWGSREEVKSQQIEFYNAAGYNVFSIDYRLAPETKLPDIVEDIDSAIQWVKQTAPNHFDIDVQRIAVVGSSAGAYLALMTGTFKTKPQAIVSFYGYGDISADWALKPSRHYLAMTKVPKTLADMIISDKVISSGPIQQRYALYMYARQQGAWIEEITGLNPEVSKAELTQFCPLYQINNAFPPTLLLHGTNDDDVPYEQSQKMDQALIRAGLTSQLITIPNGKHVFDDDWENPIVQQAFQDVVTFLEQHLNR
ncbi:alpha/beta hydrolase [Bacillus rubiinfantis]|uniref:alpha/beta hydrolase n=1 Tax=Bacillus rubiinfantis TaxID=1499680 RepID=UPI0005A7F25D|nr:alpha/beta hydrolase [Bacillus rubiinfantis]